MRSRWVLIGSLLTVAFLTASCGSKSSESSKTSATASEGAANTVAPVLETTRREKFAPLNQAVGFGRLRVMGGQERPAGRDVVIYRSLPNEVPRVAGIITTVSQTPLSHVNLRAVQDKVPNAFIGDAMESESVKALVDKLVRYEVTSAGYTIEPATQREVEDHFAKLRPDAPLVPARDLSVRTISALRDISFEQSKSYGVKAANVAVLGRFENLNADVPDGFAIPFYFYDQFMTSTGLTDRAKRLLAEPKFQSDLDRQEADLSQLRDDDQRLDYACLDYGRARQLAEEVSWRCVALSIEHQH